MKHKDAPIRVYRRANGTTVVWVEAETKRPGWTQMEQPDTHWTLIRGFTSETSCQAWLDGTKKRLKNPW